MGKSAILAIRIVSNSRDGEAGLDRVSRKLRDVGRDSAKSGVELSRMYDSLDGMASGTLKVAALSSALLSATSHAAGLARGLAPIAGLAGAIPGALAVGATVVGTMKVATSGFADAVEAAGKGAAEFEKATAGMAPAARDAARAVREVQDSFSPTVTAVQQTYWSGLSDVMRDTAAAVLPSVSGGMVKVAAAANGVTRSLAAAAVEAEKTGVIAKSFDTAATVLDRLRPAIPPLVAGLASIVSGSLDIVGGFRGLTSQAQAFQSWAARISSDGTLSRWFANGATAAGQLWGVLSGATRVLLSVLKAASEAGGAAGLGGLADSLSRLADEVSRPEIQAQMRDAFTQANTVVREATSAFIALLPYVIRLAPLLTAAALGWRAFATASALFKGASMIATFLRLGPAVTAAATQVGLFYSGLTSSQAAASAFSGAAGTLGGKVAAAAGALRAAATAATAWVAAIARAAAAQVAAAARAVAGWIAAAASAVASAATQVAAWVATGAAALAQGARIAAAWVLAMGPVGWVVAAIIGIVAAFVVAYNKCEWFRNAVNAAMAFIRNAVGVAASWVAQKFSAGWAAAKNAGSAFSAATSAFLARVRAVVGAVGTFISSGFARAWAAASRGVATFKSIVLGAMDRVRAVIDSVRAAVSNVMNAAREAASVANPFSWFAADLTPTIAATLPPPNTAMYLTAATVAPRVGPVARAPRGGDTHTVVNNFYIDGALDSDGVAAQIKGLLERSDVRAGRRARVGGDSW